MRFRGYFLLYLVIQSLISSCSTNNISSSIVNLEIGTEWRHSYTTSTFSSHTRIDTEGIAVDNEGSVYAVGYTNVEKDFDPDPEIEVNVSGTFLCKYYQNGSLAWVRTWSSNIGTSNDTIDVDKNGNIYFAGTLRGDTDDLIPDKIRYPDNSSDYRFFILKLNCDGEYQWGIPFGGGGSGHINKLIVDKDIIYLTGNFREAKDFDPGNEINILTAGEYGSGFLARFSTDGEYRWALTLGSRESRGLALDPKGGIYVTGNTYASDIARSPYATVLSTEGYGAFLRKFNKNGDELWVRHWNGFFWEHAPKGNCVAADSNGGVYVCGYYTGTIDFDPGQGECIYTGLGRSEAYLSKFDSDGNFLWAKSWGERSGDNAATIGITPEDEIIVAGHVGNFGEAVIDFDPGTDFTGYIPAVQGGGYLSRFNSDGEFQSYRIIQSGSFNFINAMAIDASGSVCLTGGEGIGFFIARYIPDGFDDAFLDEKTDASKRETLWAQSWSNENGHVDLFSVSSNGNGVIQLAGRFEGTVDFGTTGVNTRTSKGMGDAFLCIVNNNGTINRLITFGGPGEDAVYAVAVHSSHHSIYCVAGEFSDTVDFSQREDIVLERTSNGNTDAFLARFTRYGYDDWVETWGGSGRDFCCDIDERGSVNVSGVFHRSVGFPDPNGRKTVTTNGPCGIFNCCFRMDGRIDYSLAWDLNHQITDPSDGPCISLVKYGESVISGLFNDILDCNPGSDVDEFSAIGYEDNPDLFSAYMIKINPQGAYEWARVFGGNGNIYVNDINFDRFSCNYSGREGFNTSMRMGTWEGYMIDRPRLGHGDVYIVGTYSGTDRITFARPDSPHDTGVYLYGDTYLFRFNEDGEIKWTRTWNPGDNHTPVALLEDNYRCIYLAGTFSGDYFYDFHNKDEYVTAIGDTDIHLTKFNNSGYFEWIKTIGGDGPDNVHDIEFTKFWQILMIGTYSGSVDFDTGPVELVRTSDDTDTPFFLSFSPQPVPE